MYRNRGAALDFAEHFTHEEARFVRWSTFSNPDKDDNEPSGFAMNDIPLSGRSFKLLFHNRGVDGALAIRGG